MSMIKPGLFIGNWLDAQNLNLLKRKKISHILCTAGELHPVFPKIFIYKCIRGSDHPMYNLGTHFEGAADFINRGIKEGTGVLVHCHAGISRSTSCMIAYLMKHNGLGLGTALSLCRKRRPIVNPNPGFMKQLRDFERKVARNRIFEDKMSKLEGVGNKSKRRKNKFYSTVGGNYNNNDDNEDNEDNDNELEDNPYQITGKSYKSLAIQNLKSRKTKNIIEE